MSISRLMQMARAGVPASGGDVWTDPDLANASYDSVSFSVGTEETTPTDIDFNDDGSKMFVFGATGDDINEYDLTSQYDISTATFSQNASVTGSNPYGMFMRKDGVNVYIVGLAGVIYQHSMSTPWDISTLTYDSVSFDASAQVGSLRDIWFKDDGTKMYLVDATGDDINEYTLSTAWDVSTASYVQNFSLAAQDNTSIGVYFNPDGTKFWIYGFTSDTAYEYDLSTAWDLSTASYSSVTFDATAQVSFGLGITFSRDGSKMYVSDNTGDTIYQYSTVAPAPAAWTDPDLANASYDSVSFSVSGQENSPWGVFFKPDGAKMYVTGGSGDDINEYSLSSAWDVSSASFVQNFSVSSQDTGPRSAFFRSDGFKMYVVGSVGDDINEYDLSTAWDVSTASFVQNRSTSSQDTNPSCVVFKPDGLKMYVSGRTGTSVYEYDLSTAWDISTSSFLQSFSVNSQETGPNALFFSPNGDVMFIAGNIGDDVNEYSLSTPWDISTSSFVRLFSVASQETYPTGLFFKSDGSKMYVVGLINNTIYQYSTA